MISKAPYAVIVDSDPGTALSLRHLFRVICGLSAEVFASDDAALSIIQSGDAPKVVVVGRLRARSEFLKTLVKIDSGSFVIAIDRQEQINEAEDAFLAGAHDVVRYPISLRAFALRLRARVGMLDTPEGLEILRDTSSWNSGAYIASQAALTSAEAQIAHILISQNGEVVSRDVLSYAIDHRPWDYGDRKFDVHVAKIRKKLTAVFGEHVSVKTVRAEGYVLSFDEDGIARLFN